MSKHTIIAVRHAKASHYSSGTDDMRPLTDAGVTQARELGKRLTPVLREVDTVFVSPAVRAQQTWENIVAGAALQEVPRVVTEQVIYDGSPSQIIEAVLSQASGASAMVVGHEPTISSVAYNLVQEGEATEIEYGMPTGSAAIIESDGPWDRDEGVLADFVHVRA